MIADQDSEVAALAAAAACGSVVAAAGCGKTEQVARAAKIAQGRRLILTHTHAGVDALRARLVVLQVPCEKYRLETIAGWCLRYAASFPQRSGLPGPEPLSDSDWAAVYESATRLIASGAVREILVRSYSGAFVDEYQDCTRAQHGVIKSLAAHFPVCVFGDPLQAIFDFKGQEPVSWENDVFPVFAKVGVLTRPWRWENAGNAALAEWLSGIRETLEGGGDLDLTKRPQCVHWESLPDDPKFRQAAILGACKATMGRSGDRRLVVIGDSANIGARAALAKSLSQYGFSAIEPVSCQHLYAGARKIEAASGFGRLETVMDFVSECMTGAERKEFLEAVKSRQNGGSRGAAKFGILVDVGLTVAAEDGWKPILELMDGFGRTSTTRIFRREMYSAMKAALRIIIAGNSASLVDAIWEIQNRIRHGGRKIGTRAIGSVLLVKGLQFEHAVIIHAANMTRKDWYVALTRATDSITILAPSQRFAPAA